MTPNTTGEILPYAPPPPAPPAMAPARFSLPELREVAQDIAASRMFPGIDSQQKAIALFLLCESEGLHPMAALRRYHIIEGRPSLKADVMLAEFHRAGGRVRWLELSAAACEAEFSHPVTQPEPVRIRTTLAELEASGVSLTYNRDRQKWETKAVYQRYPRAMLRSRVVSEGIRTVAPGINCGIPTPEEAADEWPTGTLEADPLPPLPGSPLPARLDAPPASPASAPVAAADGVGGTVDPPWMPPRERSAPVTTTAAAPAKAGDNWRDFARAVFNRVNDAFATDLAVANIPMAKRKGIPKPVRHVNEAVHHLVTAAINAGHIVPAQVTKPEKPDIRDVERCNEAAEWLYTNRREWTRAEVIAWAQARLTSARQTAGLEPEDHTPTDDPAAESAGSEPDPATNASGQESDPDDVSGGF